MSSAICVAICRYSGGESSEAMLHSVSIKIKRTNTDSHQFTQHRWPVQCICTAPTDYALRLLQVRLRKHSEGMNLLDPTPCAPMLPFTLEPGQAVVPLYCRAGQRAMLEVLEGRLWLTQRGRSHDWFLEAGQCLTLQGPAVLYASAEGTTPLRLRWGHEASSRPTPSVRLSAA